GERRGGDKLRGVEQERECGGELSEERGARDRGVGRDPDGERDRDGGRDARGDEGRRRICAAGGRVSRGEGKEDGGGSRDKAGVDGWEGEGVEERGRSERGEDGGDRERKEGGRRGRSWDRGRRREPSVCDVYVGVDREAEGSDGVAQGSGESDEMDVGRVRVGGVGGEQSEDVDELCRFG